MTNVFNVHDFLKNNNLKDKEDCYVSKEKAYQNSFREDDLIKEAEALLEEEKEFLTEEQYKIALKEEVAMLKKKRRFTGYLGAIDNLDKSTFSYTKRYKDLNDISKILVNNNDIKNLKNLNFN